jgi:hypothetical protein
MRNTTINIIGIAIYHKISVFILVRLGMVLEVIVKYSSGSIIIVINCVILDIKVLTTSPISNNKPMLFLPFLKIVPYKKKLTNTISPADRIKFQ